MKIGKVNLQSPIKMDVTADEYGNIVQYNGTEWLAYDGYEAQEFRQKCLDEFEDRMKKMTDDNLDDVCSVGIKGLKGVIVTENDKDIWNAAIEAAAELIGKSISYPTQACAIIRTLKK